MEGLPLDTSHPVVRDYLSLIRLQVLTPLSLLINIATVMVCTIVVTPSIDDISKLFPTSLTPKPWMLAVYVVGVYLLQIGYCLMLVMARKPETKQTLINGVGQALVWANWTMAGYAVAFLLQKFVVATVLIGLTTLLLLYSNLKLLWLHAPTSERPLDTGLIHAPLRLFLILPFGLLLWQSLIISLGHWWNPGKPQQYARYQWESFGIFMGFNILSLLVIIFRRDIVWCAGASWIAASVWAQKPKPFPVATAAMVFMILHPIVLACVGLYVILRRKDRGEDPVHGGHAEQGQARRTGREGPIRLPGEEARLNANSAPNQAQGPREVDTEAVWG